MGSLVIDVKRAKYSSRKIFGDFSMPKIEGSYFGTVFRLTGAILAMLDCSDLYQAIYRPMHSLRRIWHPSAEQFLKRMDRNSPRKQAGEALKSGFPLNNCYADRPLCYDSSTGRPVFRIVPFLDDSQMASISTQRNPGKLSARAIDALRRSLRRSPRRSLSQTPASVDRPRNRL